VQTRHDILRTVVVLKRLSYYLVLRGSHMPRRLAQHRMTLSDLEWPHRAISAIAELLVSVPSNRDR